MDVAKIGVNETFIWLEIILILIVLRDKIELNTIFM